MIHLPTALLVAADENRLEYLTRGFRQRPKSVDFGSVMIGVGVVVGFIIALWILSRLMDRRKERGPSNNRLGLFLALCKAHGLKWSQKLLLWRLARHMKLRDPARVFLEPEHFSPEHLGRSLQGRKEQFKEIFRIVFTGVTSDGSSQSTEAGGADAISPATA